MTIDDRWVEHAYPLQQIVIQLQGTRHSERETIVNQLEKVLARLRRGDANGYSHDDDFGYRFEACFDVAGPSFFTEPCGEDPNAWK